MVRPLTEDELCAADPPSTPPCVRPRRDRGIDPPGAQEDLLCEARKVHRPRDQVAPRAAGRPLLLPVTSRPSLLRQRRAGPLLARTHPDSLPEHSVEQACGAGVWRSLRTVAPSAAQAKLAAGMPRKQLVGFGTAFGKFTKSKQFRLHVTCLDFVAQHAQHDSAFNRRASQHCPSWPPAPPQGAPGGSGRLDSPSGRAQPLGAQPLPRVLGPTRRLQWRRLQWRRLQCRRQPLPPRA